MTRSIINSIILKHSAALANGELSNPTTDDDPEESNFYFGLLILDETVVTIFKNNQNISVTPADVNVLLNFIKSHQEVMKRLQPCFEEICLPGMTEEYKLPVFFKYNEVKLKTDPTNPDGSANPADLPPHRCLKLVYAC